MTLEILRREELGREMRPILEHTLDERVQRYVEVAHQGIIPNHHFAAASSECIDLYRDGYSLSAVMVSQAVTEGIWRFVLERNSSRLTAIVRLRRRSSSNEGFCQRNVPRRNDGHHTNPSVSRVPLRELAKRNLLDLATIEREIFAIRFDNGKLVPMQPRYWDLQPGGTMALQNLHPRFKSGRRSKFPRSISQT
jgi:hypothetical protein